MEWFHVYPIDDLIEHNLGYYDAEYICPCNPVFNVEEEMIVHNAMDRREVFES